MPVFRNVFFLKRAELLVSFFGVCAELWVPFEEVYRIMGTILGKCGKKAKKSKGYAK